MTKYIIIFLATLFLSQDKEVPIGTFNSKGGYTYSRLTLKQDKTFEQENGSCNWRYYATGKWAVNSDTIKLTADNVYSINLNWKKTLVTDTIYSEYKYFKKFNQYYIISADTLVQFQKSLSGKMYATIKLTRTTAKSGRH